ncbi:hypothetical protein H0H92_002369 [Tricholoma furcatifolium]|nr:hypothetical protein H0H92_002369 [Tricholoma furcatifolium]
MVIPVPKMLYRANMDSGMEQWRIEWLKEASPEQITPTPLLLNCQSYLYYLSMSEENWEKKVAEITNLVWRATPYSNLSQIGALLDSTDKSKYRALLRNELPEDEFTAIWQKSTKIDYIGYMCEAFAIRVADGVLKAFSGAKPLFQHTGDNKKLGHGFVAMQKGGAATGDPWQLVDSSIAVAMSLPIKTFIWQDGDAPWKAHEQPPPESDNPHKDSAVIYRLTADIYYWEKNTKLTPDDHKRITAKLDRDGMIMRTRRQALGSKGLGPSASILLAHEKAEGPNVVAVWVISYPSTAQLTLKTFAEGKIIVNETWELKTGDVRAKEADITNHLENAAKTANVTSEERGMMRMVLENVVTSL